MKKVLILGGLLLVLGVGYYFGKPFYRDWKQERFLKQAREYLAKEDYKNAALCARQVINLNGSNVEAARIMARITETFRSPLALSWWQRVLSLQPATSNRLEVARCALLTGNFSGANQALSAVPPKEQDSATFHQLAAMAAMAENNIAKADWHFGRATEFDPKNKSYQFNRAIIRLQAKNQEIVKSALQTLNTLTADPLFRKDALRHLAMTAIKNKDFTQAEEFARQLQSTEGVAFEDRILQLSILQAAASSNFSGQLDALKAEAVKVPDQINTLASWMGSHGLAAGAMAWLASLPDKLQVLPPVRMARADILMGQRDWTGLEALLTEQNWGELDFIRLAQLARAAAEQKQGMVASSTWQAAVRAADDHLKSLTLLTRLATAWGWDREQEELLWFITQRFPAERWALQSLNQLYMASGNTRGLQKVFTTLADYNSTDVIAQNNLASVQLLLNPQSSRAYEMARTAHEKHPQIAAFTATHGYALHLQNRTAEGLKLLAALPAAELESPGIAIYYGVMLASRGETNAAKKYLDIAAAAPLLPEEKELIKAARGER
jgi:predicted Zn-dependent protease